MIKKILRSKWFTIVAIVLALITTSAFVRREPALDAIRQEQKRIDARMHELKTQASELQARREYLQSTEYLQLQARIKLNYKKPDEKVVYVYHPAGASEKVNQTEESESLSFWKRLWYYVIGK